jgi:hypothetical protein
MAEAALQPTTVARSKVRKILDRTDHVWIVKVRMASGRVVVDGLGLDLELGRIYVEGARHRRRGGLR